MKLKKMPYAQASVTRYEDGGMKLTSYTTDVVFVNSEGWLYCRGLYSRTTIRHISAFCSEIGTDYYTAKAAYVGGYAFNLRTGEVAPAGCFSMDASAMERAVQAWNAQQQEEVTDAA